MIAADAEEALPMKITLFIRSASHKMVLNRKAGKGPMNTKHYFACGHTAKGYVNLLSSNLEPLNKLFILKGGPGMGKLPFMKKIGSALEGLGQMVEYIHSPSDPDALDGVLFPGLGVGMVDGTPPHVIEPRAPGALEEYINLGAGWNTEKLAAHTAEILELRNQVQLSFEKAYIEFAKGLKVHDEWEKIYIRNMDFAGADRLTEEVIHSLLGASRLDQPGSIKHRFFGGSTPRGQIDYIPNITEDIDTRYFLKGRPGTGKSTMLKKIAEKAHAQGNDIEIYHCGFDPDSLDMLLFPELKLCIFDSTSPHEYYPSRESDQVIDMYSKLITPGTDELYDKELADITARYKAFTGEGIAYLASAKTSLEKLEQIYNDATDFYVIDRICNELLLKTLKFQS